MKASLSSFNTGVSNFAIQYNYQSASIALIIMSSSVCSNTQSNCDEGLQDSWVSGTTTAMVLLGSIFGQLSMGYLGDQIGRNMAMLLTVSIACLFAFLQCVASGDPLSIYRQIAAYRFFLGIGLGGIYPLSATKASEDGSAEPGKVDSTKTSSSYFWQMPGILSPWLLAYILARNDHLSVDTKWRIVYGIGAIPLLLCAFGLIAENAFIRRDRYTTALITNSSNINSTSSNSSNNSNSNSNSKSNSNVTSNDYSLVADTVNLNADVSSKSLLMHLSDPINLKKLMGTGGVWFLYDIAQYGALMTSGQIIREISNSSSSEGSSIGIGSNSVSSDTNIENVASKTCIAMACATLSTLLAVIIVPILGLKNLQMASFSLMAFFLLLFSSLFNLLTDSKQFATLFALYIFSYSSIHSGQNITTYVLPSALFPKEIRTTFNGIACAMAKLGAFIGAFTYIYIAKAAGFPAILGISCCLSLLAVLLTYAFVDEEVIASSSSTPHHPRLETIESIEMDSIVPTTVNKFHFNQLGDPL